MVKVVLLHNDKDVCKIKWEKVIIKTNVFNGKPLLRLSPIFSNYSAYCTKKEHFKFWWSTAKWTNYTRIERKKNKKISPSNREIQSIKQLASNIRRYIIFGFDVSSMWIFHLLWMYGCHVMCSTTYSLRNKCQPHVMCVCTRLLVLCWRHVTRFLNFLSHDNWNLY